MKSLTLVTCSNQALVTLDSVGHILRYITTNHVFVATFKHICSVLFMSSKHTMLNSTLLTQNSKLTFVKRVLDVGFHTTDPPSR
jgi:hypothetical protein